MTREEKPLPLTDAERSELDTILDGVLLPGFTRRERIIARGAAELAFARACRLHRNPDDLCTCNGGPQGEGCVSLPHEPGCPALKP